jgi:hypothetical protein
MKTGVETSDFLDLQHFCKNCVDNSGNGKIKMDQNRKVFQKFINSNSTEALFLKFAKFLFAINI